MVDQVDELLLKLGRCEKGDIVVITAGSPPGVPGLDEPRARPPHRRGRFAEAVSVLLAVRGASAQPSGAGDRLVVADHLGDDEVEQLLREGRVELGAHGQFP